MVNDGTRLYGAVIGDIAGSAYEFNNNRDYHANLFPPEADYTDDTILTVATAEAMMYGNKFHRAYKSYAHDYMSPKGGYGASFSVWVHSGSSISMNSKGNGCAMRVSPCAYASKDLSKVLDVTTKSVVSTHNHWQSVRMCHALVNTIYLLNEGLSSKEEIIITLRDLYGIKIPSLSMELDKFRKNYRYTELVEETVPQAIWCALSANSFEDAIRRAISLGGDADTLGAITGSVAECIHEIPTRIMCEAVQRIPYGFKDTIECFNEDYIK